jgi:hypothetical protein
MKTKYGILWLLCTVLWLGACQNEGISYYPIGKKHLGETYTEYVMNNVVTTDTVSRIVLNFYPEEVTSLPYMSYDEAACAFAFHPGKTSRYWISWDYETDGSYVEVQYGQNGVWYTINEQRRSGEFLLTANDNMTVRMCIRSGGRASYSDGQTKYAIAVTVNRFNIREEENGTDND